MCIPGSIEGSYVVAGSADDVAESKQITVDAVNQGYSFTFQGQVLRAFLPILTARSDNDSGFYPSRVLPQTTELPENNGSTTETPDPTRKPTHTSLVRALNHLWTTFVGLFLCVCL